MGNYFSSKTSSSSHVRAHRKIYIGNVPEIQDDVSHAGQVTTGKNGTYGTINAEGTPKMQKAIHRRKLKFTTNKIITSRYTILNFIPKTIFEQFHRFVNVYFLCVVLLQGLSDSPVSPASTGAAFVFVISASILKQAYEDWLRHKADAILNNKIVKIVKDGKIMKTKSKDIQVGDILKLENDEQVPADLLVLGSSDELYRCQITTVNLDGETNFKVRYCPSGLPTLKTEAAFTKFRTIIECEEPTSSLYTFNGTIFLPKSLASTISTNEENSNNPESSLQPASVSSTIELKISNEIFLQLAVSIENVVLRGTTLKNTNYVYGLVLYTGQDTRLSQNSKKTHTKFSTVEKSINTFLIAIVAILITLISICTGLYFSMKSNDELDPANATYLPPAEPNSFAHFFHIFSSFFVLFNYIIPISLYVTIELQKFFGSLFFVWDQDMTCPKTGQAPLCNTSDLNEELGQIEYLFSDKTGTLTENIMKFQHCSINGIRYDFSEAEGKLYDHLEHKVLNVDNESMEMTNFFKILSLCHTVQLMPAAGLEHNENSSTNATNNEALESVFHASSPDEKALLEAAFTLGVKYMGENEDILTVDCVGAVKNFKRLLVLEFDPDRKRMSIIIQNHHNEIWLLSKGAESAILPKCISGPTSETLTHVNEFACMGMRTLAIAERKLTAEEFETFLTQLNGARRLLIGRDEAIRELYNSIESNLVVVGATGVEDQLQDGVPETIQALSAAGIKIWMLTGDKLETGINIAISCGLMSTNKAEQIILANCTSEDTIEGHLQTILYEKTLTELESSCFVLDGETLENAILVCPELLQEVVMKIGRVVCCRMAPLQKAQVVKLVKTSKGHPITAAVGDGANDVAMLQEAHIGLGILGKEGRQAARCSDFAVARFSFLKKAILVHGYWYYYRLAKLVLFFFYKNIVFILPPAFAGIFNAFSSQTLFNPFYMTTYNIFYSSAPILAYGLGEQPISAEKLLSTPELYKTLSKNQLLSWSKFIRWIIHAIWHAILAFFLPVLAWSTFVPLFNDWASFGMFIICAVVALTNMKLMTETKYNTIWTLFTYGISYVSFFLFTTIYAEIDLKGVLRPRELRHAFWTIQSHPGFWFTIVLITALGVLPELAWKALWNTVRPNKTLRKLKKSQISEAAI